MTLLYRIEEVGAFLCSLRQGRNMPCQGVSGIKLSLYGSCVRAAVVANDCPRIRLQRGDPSGEITWKFGGK